MVGKHLQSAREAHEFACHGRHYCVIDAIGAESVLVKPYSTPLGLRPMIFQSLLCHSRSKSRSNRDGSRPRSGDGSKRAAAENGGDVDVRTLDLWARTSGGAAAAASLSGEGL